jgi:hypothetical protein
MSLWEEIDKPSAMFIMLEPFHISAGNLAVIVETYSHRKAVT